jgi:hypothetical protein
MGWDGGAGQLRLIIAVGFISISGNLGGDIPVTVFGEWLDLSSVVAK